MTADGKSTWINMETFASKNLNLNSGEWVYVEKYFIWDGTMFDKGKYDEEKSAAISRICPRVGAYSGGVVDDGLAEDSPTRTISYWIDNLILEPAIEMPEEPGEEEFENPYVEDASLTGNALTGHTLTLEYLCKNDAGKQLGTTYIRVVKEMASGDFVEEMFESEENRFEYVVPERLAGNNLRFELLPITAEGIPGVIYKVAVGTIKHAQVVKPSLEEPDVESASVTGNLYVENNVPGIENLDLFIVVAVYDKNGCAVRMNSKSVSVPAESSANVACTVSTTEEPEFAPVNKVKVFVWGGADVFHTNMFSYAAPLEKDLN